MCVTHRMFAFAVISVEAILCWDLHLCALPIRRQQFFCISVQLSHVHLNWWKNSCWWSCSGSGVWWSLSWYCVGKASVSAFFGTLKLEGLDLMLSNNEFVSLWGIGIWWRFGNARISTIDCRYFASCMKRRQYLDRALQWFWTLVLNSKMKNLLENQHHRYTASIVTSVLHSSGPVPFIF